MKRLNRKLLLPAALAIALTSIYPLLLLAQNPWEPAPLTTPAAQRSAQGAVRAQVQWFRNTTHTARNYLSGSYDMVWQQFQTLRGTYGGFVASLSPRQMAAGANELEQLNAGLDILQEAFGEFQDELAAGRPESIAFRRMCKDLDEAAGVWLQEFNKCGSRLRVGWP